MPTDPSTVPSTARPPHTGVIFSLGAVAGAALLWILLHVPLPFGLGPHVAGDWTGSAEVEGTDVYLSLTMQEKDGTYSGTLNASPGGSAQFDQMKVDPTGKFSFDIDVDGEKVAFDGQLSPDGNSMSGKLNSAHYGKGTWTLTKNKPAPSS